MDQTAAPTAAITIAAGTVATGEFDDAATKKFYVTSASTAQTSGEWGKYIDYAMSSVADGGLNQTAFDLTALTLDNAQVAAFFSGFTVGQKAAVTSLSLKLATAFGANTLTLADPTGFTNLTGADAFKLYRNSAANVGILVSVDYNGWNDAVVQLIDPTATSVADQTSAQDWLKYLSYVTSQSMFDATSGVGAQSGVLNLSSLPLASSGEATALITALGLLDSSLKAKLTAIDVKLASGDFGVGTLALSGDLSNAAGFTNLSKFMVDASGTETNAPGTQKFVDFTGLSVDGSKDMWVSSLASVDYDSGANAAASWLAYIHYNIRNNDADFALDTSAINSGNGLTVAQAGYLFDALATLSTSGTNKVRLTSVNVKLANAGGAPTLTINQDLSNLDGLTSIIVNATDAMNGVDQVAVDFSTGIFHATTTTKKAIVSTISSVDKDSQDSWTYYFNTAAMTSVDVSSTTLTSAEATAFLTALGTGVTVAADITSLTMKLAPAFGAASLTLPAPAGFTNLTGADAFKLYRNTAANVGTLVSVDYNGWNDSVVQIIDPTATTVADTAEAQQWLGYLTGVLNDSASGATLDLSSIAIDDAQAVTAFNAAITCLDSALSSKVAVLKLAVTHAADISLGTGSSGFSNLSRIEFTKTATNTVTFAGALSVGRTYLTNLASVKMDTSTDWSRYLNYMLSTTNGGQSALSLNLNSRTFADQTALDAFFAGLNALSSKNALTTLRMKLADGLNAISIGRVDNTPTAATGLAAGLIVIVDPGTSTGTIPAGAAAGEVQADNLIVLASRPAFSKNHIAYLAEQNGFAGTIDLSGLNLDWTTGTNTLIQDLNLLSADTKAAITTIYLKLQSGAFGSSTLTLGALTGFTGVTFNINRNGAVDGANTYGALVTVTNNTTHTVNLTDAEFHNMSTFSNLSSANWIGYLTHELNSAAASYTLDLTVNPALMLDSANAVSAFSSALRYLPDSLKTKVALLKVKSSTNGDFGATDWNGPGATERVIPEYAAFDNLASIAIEYTATGLNMGAYVGSLDTTTKYSYVSTPFNGMDWNDWTKFFNYQLNATNVGGLGGTAIVLAQRLSSAELTATLAGLGAASQKALLQNLTLNLASDVVGDINVDVAGLTALTNVIINANGSVAKLTPTNSFIGKTTFSSISNVKATSADSWAAYLAGQSSITAIDVREIELADQAELTAFLTALNAESRKADVASLKMKLASAYAVTTDFSGIAPAGLTALTANNSVEIHRNGSAATAVQGGEITDAKIKLVDLTASSLTDRSSDESWRRYLTTLIEATPGAVDLSTDSDTYLRTNAHLTAFMSGLQNLSPANKLLVTSLKLELASSATWTNITNLGQGLTGFTNLASFILDATGAYTSAGGNPQVTVAFHADMAGVATKKAIVSSLSSVDKDSSDSWTYFFNSAAMTSVDVSSVTLTDAEATAFLAALGTGVTAKADIAALTMKLDPTFGAASLALSGTGLAGLQVADAVSIQRNGAVNAGSAVSINLSNGLTSTHVRIVDPTITDADSVLKTSASSWLAYLTNALAGAVTVLDLTDDNLVLGTVGQATALSTALDALDSSLKAKIATLKVKAAANVTIGATLTSAAGFTTLSAIELDKPAANTITVSTIDATTRLHISALDKVNKTSSASWEYYLNYVTRAGAAGFDVSGSTITSAELAALDTALNTFSTAAGNAAKLSSIHIKVSGAAGVSNYPIAADLDAQTAIDSAAKFIVDVSGFTDAGTQATVSNSGGATKSVELRISGASDLYRNFPASWDMYLNSVYAGGIPAASTVDLTSSSSLYLRSQADVNALMTAIQARSDKANINTLNVRLAPGSVGSDIIFGTDVTGINPTMNITATGSTNNGNMIAAADIHYAGSFTSTGKTVTQDFASSVTDKTVQEDWVKYLTYVLSSVDAGGLGHVSIVARALTSAGELTALMGALNIHAFKTSIQHLHLDVSHASFNGALALGTGVSGLTNLTQVSYVRASAQADATAAVVGAGDFSGKIQRLRTAWNADTLTSAATIESYLRYVVMDTEMGGAELTLADLTSQALTSAQATDLNTALAALPDDLSFRITELRLNLNAADPVTFDAAGLRNLATVKYFQTGAGVLSWTNTGGVGFGAPTTKTRFRALLADVTDKADQTQWTNYIDCVMTSVGDGGLGLTTFDLSSITLTAAHVVPFLDALSNPASKGSITGITIKLDPAFGAASLDLSPYSGFTSLGADSVTIQRNAAVDTGAPVTITYSGGGSFSDANVKIIDPETNTTADKDNTRQQWLEYLTYTIHTVGLTGGLLTIAPGDAFTLQSQIYLLFDAMEALDPSLKAAVNRLHIDLSSIAGGTVSLAQTGNAALTGFSNLTAVTYARGNVNTDIVTVTANLNTALDTQLAAAASPDLDGGWPYADNATLLTAVDAVTVHGDVSAAIAGGDPAALKTTVIARLAAGITIPVAGDRTTAVSNAVNAVIDDGVTGGTYNLVAALTAPARVATEVTNTVKSGAGAGTLYTGLDALTWLNNTWAGVAWNGSLANIDAVIDQAITDENATITNIFRTATEVRNAIRTRILADFIPIAGTIGGGEANSLAAIVNSAFADAAVTTAITNNDAGALDTALVSYLSGALGVLCPWININDGGTNRVTQWANSSTLTVSANAGATYNWVAADMKDPLLTSLVSEMGTRFTTPLTTAVNTAFVGLSITTGFTPNKGVISAAAIAALQGVGGLTAVNFPWYASANATAIATMVSNGFIAATSIDTALDTAVSAASVEGANPSTVAQAFVAALKTYYDNGAIIALPTANSLFQTPVNTAVDSITLASASTAVTTDFAGVAETLSRYRIAVADVTDKESASQWTEYLLHKLAPVAEGGLNATTIDISAAPLNNDQKNNFMAAFVGLPDALRLRVTSIKLTAADNTLGNLDGGGKAYNNNLKIIMVMDSYSNGTPTLSVVGGQEFFAADGTTPLVGANVIDHRLTVAPAVTAIVTEWQYWLNHKLSSTFGGEGATTIDVSGTALTRAQLTNFMTALNAVDNSILSNMTLLKIGFTESGSTALTLTGDGSKTYNTNLIVSVTSDNDYSGTISFAGTLSGGSRVLREFVTTAPAVSATSTTWQRYINYRLTTAANGGAEATTIDLSATHAFASQAQLDAFFTGLETLGGTGGNANKNVLQSLTLKLAAGNFAAASARIGYTGSAAVTNLKADIAVTVQRNGARNGLNPYDPMVTIDHSDIVTSGAESIVDNEFVGGSVIASDTANWLEYLNTTLTAAGAAYDLALTDVSMELDNNKATALFNALQALNTNLKAKIATISTKLDTLNQVAGALSFSGTLNNAAGFTALTRIIVDVTDAETDVAGTQKIINWGGLTTEAAVKKVMWVNNLASVDFDSGTNAIDSWLAYLNYITRTGNASLDTSTINSGNGLTDAQAGYLFTALANFSTANDNANRLTSVVTKLAAAPGAATLIVNQDLSNLSGLTTIMVDATNSTHTGSQVTVAFNSGTFHATTTRTEAYVTQPQFSSSISWGYFINYYAGQNLGIESIDLSANNIAYVDNTTTQGVVDAFFAALEARTDKASVKDISLNLTGIDGLSINVGTGTTGLTGLTYVAIRRHAGAGSTFIPAGDVNASDRAIINSDYTGLGAGGTAAQWKGYLAYLLENAAHGGAYTGSDPIALNLTAADLKVATSAVLQDLQNALAELPVRLKARISAILIKTVDDTNNLSGNAFGVTLDTSIADFSNLKAVVIDASATTTGGNKPTFPGVGAFFSASTISKIVY